MIENIEELKEDIRKRIDNVKFHPHFYDSLKKRPYLNAGFVVNMINEFDKYQGFQTQEVEGIIRHRIGITLSKKYTFVVVIEIHAEGLNIITAWKTDRKWQKATQK